MAGRRTRSSSCPTEVRADFAARDRRSRPRGMCRVARAVRAVSAASFPELAAELKAIWSGRLPEGWDRAIPVFPPDAKGQATRVSSGKVLNAVAAQIPWFLGGSADLAPSNNTHIKDAGHFGPRDRSGRNFHFGIREHGMAAALNGMALCGLRPLRRHVLCLYGLPPPLHAAQRS